MRPFRYAYALFNPQYIVNAYRETIEGRDGRDKKFYVTITFRVGYPLRIHTIDEVEQERTLAAFFSAWEAAAAS